MDFGLFVILSIVGAIGYVRQSFMFVILSIAIFFSLALFMFAGEQVTMKETSQSSASTFDANSTLTSTEETTGSKQLFVLENQQTIVAWIIMAAAFGAVFIFVKALLTDGFVGWY